MSDQKTGSTEPSARDEQEKDVLITPDGEEIDLSLTGTMQIDTEKYGKVSKNANRIASVKYAVAGLLYVLRREQSIQLASVVTVIVVVLGIWLEVNFIYWAILILALGSIWVTECLNTALESVIDLTSPDPHPLAKIGKDVASTAALVSTIVFVMVVVLMLAPRLIARFGG